MTSKVQNIPENSKNIRGSKQPKKGVSLDTLAQPVKNGQNAVFLHSENDRLKYSKKARSKHLTNTYLYKLIDLDSELKQGYWSTFHCASLLEPHYSIRKNSFVSNYCNQRWCLVCNRIRIAKAINGYKKPLAEMLNKQFVTLTNANCTGENLKEHISMILKIDNNNRQTIRGRLRKSGGVLMGVRKLECTYNPFLDSFNPHFHFIVNGVENAEMLVNGWLKLNRKHNIKVSEKAQHFTKCDNNSMLELFKYFTKFVSSKGAEERHTTAEALDTIFRAMRGKRVYQPFGGIRKVTEEVENIQSEIVEQCLSEMGNFMWRKNDWYSKNNRDRKLDEFDDEKKLVRLCGYEPSKFDKKYGDLIKAKRKDNA